MKKQISVLLTTGALLSTPVLAQDLDIKVTNLTNGVYFTPLLIAAHDSDSHLFMVGSPAGTSLQAMAEGGDISGLSSDIQSLGADIVENPAGGVLAPGSTTEFTLMHDRRNNYLSLTGMLVPTNDGFVGADSIKIPRAAGTYTYYLNGYDAGTEANDEILTGGGAPGVPGIPGDPGMHAGTGGTGVTSNIINPVVHIHLGILGDSDPSGGPSDLDSSIHRWLNPVAKMVITVMDDRGKHNKKSGKGKDMQGFGGHHDYH